MAKWIVVMVPARSRYVYGERLRGSAQGPGAASLTVESRVRAYGDRVGTGRQSRRRRRRGTGPGHVRDVDCWLAVDPDLVSAANCVDAALPVWRPRQTDKMVDALVLSTVAGQACGARSGHRPRQAAVRVRSAG